VTDAERHLSDRHARKKYESSPVLVEDRVYVPVTLEGTAGQGKSYPARAQGPVRGGKGT